MMAKNNKLIVMIGLPRSGKTTVATHISEWFSCPIVSPDAIRLATHGQRFWGPAEPQVWATCGTMISALFITGHQTLVLDATNVNADQRNQWKRITDNICCVHIPTSVDECKKRAIKTGQDDLIPVIDRMSAQMTLPEQYFTWDLKEKVIMNLQGLTMWMDGII